MPEIEPKYFTREEIDQLVEAKMPKTKIVGPGEIFVEKSTPAP